jgi:cbb3-type cytochrome oxidase subunit 3
MTEPDPFSAPAQGPARPFDPLRDEATRGPLPADTDGSGRGVLVLVVAIAIVIVFAAVVWNAYRNTGSGSSADLPIILADGPERTAAEADSGYVVPEQDNVALDQIEPVLPPAPAVPTLEGEAEARALAADTPRVLASVPSPDAPAPTPSTVRDQAAPSPAPPATSTVPAGPTPAEPGVAVVPTPGGAFLVQVAAVTRPEAAEAAWLAEVRRMPQLFEGLQRDVLRVDIPNRGVFHRIRADGFATRETALAFCQQFKARGGDCLVVARAG